MSIYRRKLMMAYAANLGRGDIVYPGLIAAWSAKGKTNEDVDRNILKDLTGNGHDITLHNFSYSGMSGYGGYNFDMTKMWGSGLSSNIKKVYKTYATIKSNNLYSSYIDIGRIQANTGLTNLGVNIRFRIRGLKNNQGIRWHYYNISGTTNELHYFYENGILEIYVPKEISSSGFLGITFIAAKNDNVDVTIELLPEYPDALVFDGVDDYGVNKDMPILTDYTIIAKRKWLDLTKGYLINYPRFDNSSHGIFIFEGIHNNATYTWSGDVLLNKVTFPSQISYQTIGNYNGQIISKAITKSNNELFVGIIKDNISKCFQGAFYSAYLFDRSLDEQEIKSFIRKYIDPEYLLPSEILPAPNVYYDFTNGDNSKGEANNVIKDLSGNGNDAVAHNFAWNEESGYAEGRLKFDGVDDYISLDTFDSVFKTMFMVCTNFEAPAGSILYDQRSELFNKNYSVAYYPSSIAYNNDNINGTYINGTLNTKLACQELNNKKHLIHVVAKDISESRKPNIGRSLGQNQYSNMMLYKFLGFKETLTEEQINTVIKKYNLLDGVDEIEVS